MKKVKVRYDGNIYEVVEKDEAVKAVDIYSIAETLVQYRASGLGCEILIDLKTGEIFHKVIDGSYYVGDTNTLVTLASIMGFENMHSLSEIIWNYPDFGSFEEEYQDWEDGIERDYNYNFTSGKYEDVFEAYVIECLKEEPKEFLKEQWIAIMIGGSFLDGIFDGIEEFFKKAEIIQ